MSPATSPVTWGSYLCCRQESCQILVLISAETPNLQPYLEVPGQVVRKPCMMRALPTPARAFQPDSCNSRTTEVFLKMDEGPTVYPAILYSLPQNRAHQFLETGNSSYLYVTIYNPYIILMPPLYNPYIVLVNPVYCLYN